ncbi:MAG: hypothetical protein BM557_02190 [Flavobacterium sp. MedPE-SWcel]|uniref:hypothetical protein n=1 Tax=uncultured Flavobacterium sp. TaxID=165435 RepID=UPI000920E88A|nr:hypothetical protein [uncultured Flavobacterium sp.]OIQ22208.1 MAG: hypothetical protein BM557_02190 [Flavobacterium sp. MedPE-SWcel]
MNNVHAILESSEISQEGSSGGTYNGTTGMMFFLTSDKRRHLKINLSLNFKFTTNTVDVDWSHYQINLTRYADGTNYSVVERINIFDLPNTSEIVNNNGQLFTVSLDTMITVQKNESLALESRLAYDLHNVHAGQETAKIECKLSQISGHLTIEEDSFHEATETKAILAHEMAERLTSITTNNNNSFYSDFLGRTDIGYSSDGEAALTAFSHGFWIRNFTKDESDEEDRFKPLTTSFRDFVESMSTVWNIGVGIEKSAHKEIVRLEELSYFYNRNTTIRLPNQVKKVKRSIANEKYYSSLEIGFNEGGEYEEACGLDEYNVKSTFTTSINRIKKSYTKLSKYKAF